MSKHIIIWNQNSKDEVIIDLDEVSQEIKETEAKIAQLTSEIDDMISQLVEVDEIPVIKRDENLNNLDKIKEVDKKDDETTLF